MVVETEDIEPRVENRGNIVLVSKYLKDCHVEMDYIYFVWFQREELEPTSRSFVIYFDLVQGKSF